MSRISEVRLTPVNVPRTTGLICGHVIVELHTDDGLTGIGEMSDFQHLPRFHVDVAELERTLGALLQNLEVEAANEATRRLEAAFPSAGHLYDKGAVIKCGVDIALWDLRGKRQGRSVSDLLGGPVRSSLAVAYPIFRQQRASDVEANLELVATRLDQGFSLFRVYVGRHPELDEAFLRSARARFGDRLRIKSLDFSNLLDAVDAARFVERTRELDYELVEAPARERDAEGLAFVRRRTLVAVSEHVYDGAWALELVAARAVDVLNVGLFALGGITPARRVAAIAEAAGLRCLVGTTQELSIGTAAAAHFGAATESASVACDPVGPLLYAGDVVERPVEYRDGGLVVPHGPGLGLAIDPERLAAVAGPLRWDTAGTDAVTVDAVIDRVRSRTS
ncbi:mandelate racemase/muconate lactonizing enzyme family protein [Jiangella endophytica]|uniref:mandelate racemase/muconate lactonizing enzyme family protein n=1 Tax=Jiangella endophytica TaxID=1623398 RepID=UPI000E34A269|nr:enolase C-terminal domain-like protein [Jiangella endophytica]